MKKLLFALAILGTASLASCADEAAEVTPNSPSFEVASETDTSGSGDIPPKKPGQ